MPANKRARFRAFRERVERLAQEDAERDPSPATFAYWRNQQKPTGEHYEALREAMRSVYNQCAIGTESAAVAFASDETLRAYGMTDDEIAALPRVDGVAMLRSWA